MKVTNAPHRQSIRPLHLNRRCVTSGFVSWGRNVRCRAEWEDDERARGPDAVANGEIAPEVSNLDDRKTFVSIPTALLEFEREIEHILLDPLEPGNSDDLDVMGNEELVDAARKAAGTCSHCIGHEGSARTIRGKETEPIVLLVPASSTLTFFLLYPFDTTCSGYGARG